MAWDKQMSERCAEWSAATVADIDFYVQLAQQADGPLTSDSREYVFVTKK